MEAPGTRPLPAHGGAFRPGVARPEAGDPVLDRMVAGLRSLPSAARALALADDPRWARPEAVRGLIDEAWRRRFDDPASGSGWARLAVAAAERTRARAPVDLRTADAEDLAAEAAAALGNALRVAGDPVEAEAWFARAGRHRADGTGDPLLAGRLADLEASLLKDRQRFAEARERLDAALAAYRDAGLADWTGRALVQLGSVLLFEERPEAALRALAEALPLLAPESDPQTFVLAAHNLVNALNRCGYGIAARALVGDLRRLHARLGDALNLLRLDWLEAQIDAELGLEDRAEKKLLAVRQGFVDRDQAFPAALVSLELAQIYARRRDGLRMKVLAREMLPVFQSRQIHREALAALIVFREAVALHQASLGLIQEVVAFLRRAQSDHTLRFRPSR